MKNEDKKLMNRKLQILLLPENSKLYKELVC